MNNKKLNETASGGAIGSGGIAVRLDGKIIDGKERRRLQDFLRSFNKKVTNRYKYKAVTPFPITVNEAFDIQDVLSRLRGLEDRPNARQEGVTYGVEDNEGNVMKVTVRKDQAGEFETTLGHELADMEAFSVTGQSGKDISMAELLFNLKDRFDIIDVQFPKIPTDVVYNADDASFNVPDSQLSNDEVPDDEFDDMDIDSSMGPDDMMNLDDMDDIEGEGTEGELPDIEGEGTELDGELEDIDADGVEDFSEPTEPEGSILDKVLDMLKSQADAERAKAEAAAEESRAKQAEYSARASEATIAQEEELARMEADMDQQKDKEKQARKLADIAKYRVSKASGLRESDDLESVAMVRRMMTQIQQQYSFTPNPNASEQENAEQRQYLAQQKANKMRELQARMRSARTREIYDAQQRRNQNQQKSQQQQNQRGQDGQQQQAGNQQGGNQGNENI